MVEPLVGEAAEALVQGAVNEGRIVLVVELENADNLENDEDVNLHMYRGRIEPDIGNLGLISPNQTVYFDPTFPNFVAENISIVDGVVEASDMVIYLPSTSQMLSLSSSSSPPSCDSPLKTMAPSPRLWRRHRLVDIFDELLQRMRLKKQHWFSPFSSIMQTWVKELMVAQRSLRL